MSYIKQEQLVNPVQKFLKWKGKYSDGFFVSYNKETKENNKEELKDFLVIDIGYNIGGGRKDSTGEYIGYFSNEIKSFDEKLRVMISGTGQELISGYYKQIKNNIKSEGGFLQLCVTILDLKDKKLKEFFLKGEAFYSFSQILKVSRGKIINFSGAEFVKGDAFDYNKPIFEITDGKINEDIIKLIDKYSDEVDKYNIKLRNKYSNNTDSNNEEGEEESTYYQPDETQLSDNDIKEVSSKVDKLKEVKEVKEVREEGEDLSIEDIPF